MAHSISREDNSANNMTRDNIMKQVNRMVAFIELEGSEKAEAITNKCEEEYNLVLGNLVQAGRLQVVNLYDKKMKTMKKEQIMHETILRNKEKMQLNEGRQNLLIDVIKDVENRLVEDTKNSSFYKDIMRKLIMQSLCVLLEKEVIVQVKEGDKSLLDSLLSDVKQDFKNLTEIDCNIIAAKKSLPDSIIGGVVMFNKKCSLKVTNTIFEKYNIILDKIAFSLMRTMIFGVNSSSIPSSYLDDQKAKHHIAKTRLEGDKMEEAWDNLPDDGFMVLKKVGDDKFKHRYAMFSSKLLGKNTARKTRSSTTTTTTQTSMRTTALKFKPEGIQNKLWGLVKNKERSQAPKQENATKALGLKPISNLYSHGNNNVVVIKKEN